MPQPKTIFLPDEYYYLYNRAVGSELLFVCADNYRYFLQQFTKYLGSVSEILCYNLQPDHFHFLIKTKSLSAIKAQMKKLAFKYGNRPEIVPFFLTQQFSNCFNSYTKAFNKQQNRLGKLFVEPFSRKRVLLDDNLSKIIHFIHVHPVQNGQYPTVEDWPYSSYPDILNCRKDAILSQEILKWFGTVEEFKKIHRQPADPSMSDILGVKPRRS